MNELRYLYESELEFLEGIGFTSFEHFAEYVYVSIKQHRGEVVYETNESLQAM